MRRCLTCGALGKASRCDSCQRGVNNARDAAPQRAAHKKGRYNAEFKSERRKWAQAIALGLHVNCARCGLPVGPAFDLDHINGGLYPSHPKCNRGKA